MYRRTARTIAAVALVAAVALPANLFAQTEAPADIKAKSSVSVNVENGHWLDVRVYAVREGGARDRIGTVMSFNTRELELPNWIRSSSTKIQLIAVPIGSMERYAAPPVIVSDGDVIEWKLANNLSLSGIWIRTS